MLATAAAVLGSFACASPSARVEGGRPVLEMRPCEPAPGLRARCGTYLARENREVPNGRRIPLDVVVIPARAASPRPDPVFFAYGGPGQTASLLAGQWAGSALNRERDIVLVDQRGASPAHALDCRVPGTPENPQGYLAPLFHRDSFRRCRAELERRADLTRYTTADYVDDLDEVRRALGYGRINIQGGSYGSRVALFYLRRYPEHVRTAFGTGVYPATLRNPLQHAADAQAALDSVFARCAREAACARAFPRPRADFAETLERLRREPARVTVPHPHTAAPVAVVVDADAFAEGVRMMMYGWDAARRLPLLLQRAGAGDLAPFAAATLRGNAASRGQVRYGLLMSVVCSEDVPRITEADVVAETRGTFLGDLRVRSQMAACEEWPRRDLPAGYTAPVRSAAPVLLVSGAYDPASGPRWGAAAAETLPNSLHVVVPGAHAAGSPCVERILLAFLDRGTVQGLDTSCVRTIRLAPFVLPGPG